MATIYLTHLFLAPEEQDVYSLQRDTARALQRSAMDANDGNILLLAERTVVECFRAINISLLRSKDRCVKYIVSVLMVVDVSASTLQTVRTVGIEEAGYDTGLQPRCE